MTTEKQRAAAKRWKDNNKSRCAAQLRRAALWRLYKITAHEVELLRVLQHNKCECCGDPFQRTPNVDHNHQTGKVRALLCNGCNTGLGCFRDSPDRLLKAFTYLLAFDHFGQT